MVCCVWACIDDRAELYLTASISITQLHQLDASVASSFGNWESQTASPSETRNSGEHKAVRHSLVLLVAMEEIEVR